MAARSAWWLDEGVARYVAERSVAPDDILTDLIAETRAATGDRAGMQIAPDQGALMALLVGVIGARMVVEVGTFTGYSALCMARAIGPDGRLICCDISEEWTTIARDAWERAGVAERIDLRIGPAAETLAALPLDDPIDLAFIDADKASYATYYEELLIRTRPNGLILVDNTLWSGEVIGERGPEGSDLAALQSFNDLVAGDTRVESYLLPVSDGLTLIRVR